MSNELVKITGLEEVNKMLTDAPSEIVRKGFRKALLAAAVPMERALRARTPVSNAIIRWDDEGFREFEDHSHSGELKADLKTWVRLSSRYTGREGSPGIGGTVDVGFRKYAYVAGWLEFGHRMVGHEPKKTELGVAAPRPFMRPAAGASASDAIQAFEDSLIETVNAEWGE